MTFQANKKELRESIVNNGLQLRYYLVLDGRTYQIGNDPKTFDTRKYMLKRMV